jgi:recA bacterial DNA recombination protein
MSSHREASRTATGKSATALPSAPGPGPASAPGASALERLRSRLSQPLDPRDPLHALAPLVDQVRSASSVAPASAASATTLSSAAQAARSLPPVQVSELLAGELPRGQLVEMVGARSSGRFSTVLAAIAAATAAGEAAALVDLGDGLDPQAAATLGVDLRRLLWLRPATLKQALAGAEILLGGGFPMVALDLGNPPVRGGRGTEAGWLRLARAARAHRAALLVASPYRVSGTAATIVLQSAPAGGGARWLGSPGARGTSRKTSASRGTTRGTGAPAGPGGPPWLLEGLGCRVTLEKCRGRLLPARPQELELLLAPLAPPAAPASPAPPAPLAPSVPLAPLASPARSAFPAQPASLSSPVPLAHLASVSPPAPPAPAAAALAPAPPRELRAHRARRGCRG